QLNCTGTNVQYGSADACQAVCKWFPPGKPGDTSGNSTGCGQSFASFAKSDRVTQCPHAGPSGGNVCGTKCEAYCSIMLGACPGMYKNPSECALACDQKLDCYFKEALVAAGDPTKCKLAIPGGGGC